MEGFVSGLTLLSSILGLPSAYISIADKISGWVDKRKYKNDIEHAHRELIDQFLHVQHRAAQRLERIIEDNSIPDHLDKDEFQRLYIEIAKKPDQDFHLNFPYYEYHLSDCFSLLIQETKAIQDLYKNNSVALELARMYTAFFFEEMAYCDLLANWYNNAANRNLLEKCDIIQKTLLECNKSIGNTFDSSVSIQESVNDVHTAVTRSEQIIQRLSNTIDNILLYLALSIIGTGVVFLVGIIFNVELEQLYLFGVPAILLLSDILVHVFRIKRNTAKVSTRSLSFLQRITAKMQWDFLEPAILQGIIASTCTFMISKIFSNEENGRFIFWIIALFLGCLAIQLIRSITESKQKEKLILNNS